MKDYISRLRSKIGHDKFIHPAARVIIENEKNEILIIKRLDNGNIGIPAGAIEENETIEECIRREVKEETGLSLSDLSVIGISSNPTNEFVEYPNGDRVQYFTIEFYSNSWDGVIKVEDKTEIYEASFEDISIIDSFPNNEKSAFESLRYFRENNKIMLK